MAHRNDFVLTAQADTVVVDVEAGQQWASTSIRYKKPAEWEILHRFAGDDWIGVPLTIVGLDDPRLTNGDFSSLRLRPGQMYEACIVPPDFTTDAGIPVHKLVIPFDNGEFPVPSEAVVALRKRPEVREFYSDGNSRTYGTYRERDVITTSPVYAKLSVGTNPWVDASSGEGLLVLPGAEHSVTRGPHETFSFLVEDLLPGTRYYELLVLMDEFGNWECITQEFTTMVRTVAAEVTELYVGNDSDDFSNGEANFLFSLYAGNPLLTSSIITYANSNIESEKVALPVPVGTCTLGPGAATLTTKRVFFHAWAIEDDAGSVPVDSDDQAEGEKELQMPVGPGENVQGATDSLEMFTVGSDGFFVRVTYKYSVQYQ